MQFFRLSVTSMAVTAYKNSRLHNIQALRLTVSHSRKRIINDPPELARFVIDEPPSGTGYHLPS
jgi:hypothetical protein